MNPIPAMTTGCCIAAAVVEYARSQRRPIRLRRLCGCQGCRALRAAIEVESERRVGEA